MAHVYIWNLESWDAQVGGEGWKTDDPGAAAAGLPAGAQSTLLDISLLCCGAIPLTQALYPISTTSEGSYRDPVIVATIDSHNNQQQ